MPTPTTAIQRPDLGVVAYEYLTEDKRQRFIGLEAMPIFNTQLQTANFTKLPAEAMLSTYDTKRASRSAYNQSDYNFEQDNYACEEHGWEETIDDRERKKFRYMFDAEVVATRRAMKIIKRNHEIRVATALFNTSTFSNAEVTTEWSTGATATPRKDVTITGRNAFKALGGLLPNAGICSDVVFQYLINTDEVRDALGYTNPVEMGGFEAQVKMMEVYLGLDKLLVGGGTKSTAKKGQDLVIADIWDDEYFMLAKIDDDDLDIEEPQLGRTMIWAEDSGDDEYSLIVESYRDESKRGDVIRVRHDLTEKVLNKSAGYLLTNISA